jgi:hypothetical protein
MATETEYYKKILQAWITKMKGNGFTFETCDSQEHNGIELTYVLADNKTFDCLIANYDNTNFNADKLHDRLHKLELLIPKLNEIYNNNIKHKENVIIFSHYHIIHLSYFLYSHFPFPGFDGPYLIETKGKPSDIKVYYTYIDNGEFKTVVGNKKIIT